MIPTVAQWLHEELYNAGCAGERRSVKSVLSLLTPRERALLAKLLERQIKHDTDEAAE